MLKFFGKEDIVRDTEIFDGSTKYSNIEFYNNGDVKTANDIGRPINNVYQNQFEIINILEEYISQDLTQDAIFENSLDNEFLITQDDIVQVLIEGIVNNYVRIPPGVAAVSFTDTENTEHTKPIISVNYPSTGIAERQIEKILKINSGSSRENVEIKYILLTDSFKAKIVKAAVNANTTTTYYYGAADETAYLNDSLAGALTGASLLSQIYNEADFLSFFKTSLIGDITLITLEPFFKITSTDTYYFYIDKSDGEIKMNVSTQPPASFLLSSVVISDLSTGSLTGVIDNTHVLFNEKKAITATSADTDAVHLTAVNGGITLTPNASGEVLIEGDLTVQGTTTTVDSDDLVVKDNVITLNDGETGAGVTKGTAGITVDRGTELNYNIVFDESDDFFKSGEVGSEKILPNLQDAPTDGVGVVWNATTKQFESSDIIGAEFIPVDEFAFDSQTDFDWSVRDSGENPITTSETALNTNRQDLYEFIELLSTKGANYQVAAGAGLIGCDSIPGVIPEGKAVNEVGNLQQVLNGILNPAVCQYAFSSGTTLAGNWNDIVFDITDREEILDASLTAGVISLEAGLYDIYAESMGNIVGDQRLRLYDTLNSTTLLAGINNFVDNTLNAGISLPVTLIGQITLTETTTLKLQHYTGAAGGIGVSGSDGERTIGSLIKITQRG